MHDDDVYDDNEAVGLPAAYSLLISMKWKHDERQTSAKAFLHEHAKRFILSTSVMYGIFIGICQYLWVEWIFDLYCVHSWGSSESRYYVITSASSIPLEIFTFYTTCGWETYVWQQEKGIQLTIHDKTTCVRLWGLAVNSTEICQVINTDAPTVISSYCPIEICINEHFRTTSDDVEPQAVCTGNKRSIFKADGCIPTSRTTALHLTSQFMYNWAISCRIQTHVLMETGLS